MDLTRERGVSRDLTRERSLTVNLDLTRERGVSGDLTRDRSLTGRCDLTRERSLTAINFPPEIGVLVDHKNTIVQKHDSTKTR